MDNKGILVQFKRDLTYEQFETEMRGHIVEASRSLAASGMKFKVFRKSICNTKYWERTREGGFLLKEGALPSKAINDIFANGRKYGTECATAIVIVFFKAALDSLGEIIFDREFIKIYLMNWQHAKDYLNISTQKNPVNYYNGDCRYFSNPDVNPLTPEWQGENAILLGGDRYYGHGIGISNSAGIINSLNRNRIPGSDTSAYLLDTATRPDFKKLYLLKQQS